MSEKRRTKAEQVLDLLEGMTRKDMREFGALVTERDPLLARMFVQSMAEGADAPRQMVVRFAPEDAKALSDALEDEAGVVVPRRHKVECGGWKANGQTGTCSNCGQSYSDHGL